MKEYSIICDYEKHPRIEITPEMCGETIALSILLPPHLFDTDINAITLTSPSGKVIFPWKNQ